MNNGSFEICVLVCWCAGVVVKIIISIDLEPVPPAMTKINTLVHFRNGGLQLLTSFAFKSIYLFDLTNQNNNTKSTKQPL